MAGLPHVLRVRCAVAKLRPYQLELGLKIDNKQDVVCVNATGTGKTVVLMAGAIAADARREKGITLLIVPTKILVEQQCVPRAEVASRRGLRALAINQDTVRDATLAERDLFKELAERDDVRMGVMTPKMLLEKDMTVLLRKPAFARLKCSACKCMKPLTAEYFARKGTGFMKRCLPCRNRDRKWEQAAKRQEPREPASAADDDYAGLSCVDF
ncbi:hypothetical protein DFH08DRAFT_821302 [Mycena albidolilacea]|uniref:DEAD/DEAH-box helicase domain-containing protein n=1 Tax=Mycena albidolilacea TaxID=1033008 RepID=A0AAD7EDB2_9AGAR|nr:hypothetical protein DFH08DRAFT_821302 [Mycena albidolilacea]